MKRCLVAALTLCLSAPWLAGCGRSYGRRPLVELIPADALVVLYVNWQAVRGDRDLTALIKGAEFKRILDEVGVNEQTVTRLAVFGDGTAGPSGSTGMLLNGSFNAREVIDAARGRGWARESYEGHEVYVSQGDGTCLAALDSGTLACGTKRGVAGVFNAQSDTKESFASTAPYKRLSKLFKEGGAPVSMILAFPQHLQDAADAALKVGSLMMDFTGVGPLGQLMSKIGYARAIGCTIGREGESFPVELVALMKDEEAATFVSGGLTLLKGIGALAGQSLARSPEEAEALRNFQNMSVSRKAEVLTVGLVMSRRNPFPN
jgi:hypothetical protein